jgi:hypothetical protein
MMQDRRLAAFIIFILQIWLSVIGPFLDYHGYPFCGIAITALFFTLLGDRHGIHRHRQEPSINARKIFFISTTFILIVGFILIRSLTDFVFPLLEIILPFAVLIPVWWVNAPRIYHSRGRILVSRGL